MSVLFLLFLATAFIFSMLGLGGGILYTPLLLNSGLAFNSAVATSLSIMVVMNLTAAAVYHSEKLIDWHILLFLEPPTMLGAYLGSINSGFFPAKNLQIFFAAVMICVAIFTFVPQKPKIFSEKKFPGFFHKEKKGHKYSINLWIGVPVSFAAGFVSSIIGIGGGFAKIPLMTLGFGVPMNIAAATSSAMIVLTSRTGVFGHSLLGHTDWKLTAILSVAVCAGAFAGSKISVKADRRILDILFSFIMLFVAAWMLYRVFKAA
jgi:uncharacterized membrane protein YfcA